MSMQNYIVIIIIIIITIIIITVIYQCIRQYKHFCITLISYSLFV